MDKTLQRIIGCSLKKHALKRWIYENNVTQPFVAYRLRLSVREFKRRLSEHEPFDERQIHELIDMMGAEEAFNVIYFPSLADKCRIFAEVFIVKNEGVKR